MTDASIRWTRAETYASEKRSTREAIVAKILDGELNGVVSNSDWYVLHPEQEDAGDSDPNILHPCQSICP